MSEILNGLYRTYVMGCMPHIVICSKATLYSTDNIQDSVIHGKLNLQRVKPSPVDGETINGIVCWCMRNCHIH